ncbi:MAG: hypothetical protein QM703_13965 [Gemmatales bacterium]
MIKLKCQRCGRDLSFVDEQEGNYSYCPTCDFPMRVVRPSLFSSKTARTLLVIATILIAASIAVLIVYPEAQEPFKEFWKLLKSKFKAPRRP